MELKDLMEKAKETKNPKELLALAKEADIEMSPQEAEENFALLNKKGELSDEELDNVAGGGCDTTVDGKSYTVVSSGLNCFTGEYLPNDKSYGQERTDNATLRSLWEAGYAAHGCCGMCYWLEFKSGIGYCGKSGK